MFKAYKLKQIMFMLADQPGLLAKVTDAVAGAGVNMSAICAYGMAGEATFLFVTDDNAKAMEALAGAGMSPTEIDVTAVELENQAGTLDAVAKRIADADINILYMYATTAGGANALCIFKTEDEDRAIATING